MTVCLDTNVFLQIFGRKQPIIKFSMPCLSLQLTQFGRELS